MAKNKTLELSIKIAGKMDKSLTAALASSQGQLGSFAKSISNIGTAGLAAAYSGLSAVLPGSRKLQSLKTICPMWSKSWTAWRTQPEK
jgi:hypothetical protein